MRYVRIPIPIGVARLLQLAIDKRNRLTMDPNKPIKVIGTRNPQEGETVYTLSDICNAVDVQWHEAVRVLLESGYCVSHSSVFSEGLFTELIAVIEARG